MHNKNSAMAFIVLLGVVSLFSDMTHEAATSIKGAYLLILGASASTIGFISGIGELLGYGLRYLFGRLVDKTHNYWGFMILGYAVDVFAVPALALVHRDGWIAACILLVIERIGKAIKKPAKNTILSFAASQEGVGKSFAIQEALDQLGAFIGPLLLYVIMLYKNGDEYEVYNAAFAFLTLPAVCTIAFLLFAKSRFPNPEAFEPEAKENKKNSFVGRKSFYLYLAGISCFAFGFVDFPLVTMHLAKNKLFDDSILPLLYSGAMLVDAVAALFFAGCLTKCARRHWLFYCDFRVLCCVCFWRDFACYDYAGYCFVGCRHGRSGINYEGCGCHHDEQGASCQQLRCVRIFLWLSVVFGQLAVGSCL